jgi:periplasmic protein TonB
MQRDQNRVMTPSRRFSIALVVAFTLHGAALGFLTGMRVPSPQPPRIMVGVLLKAPVQKPVEPSAPSPQPPAPEQPPPQPELPPPLPEPTTSPPPAVRTEPVASKKAVTAEKPTQKVRSRPAMEPAQPSSDVAESAPVSAPAPQTATVANTESASSPPLFHADYLHNPQPDYPLMSRKRHEVGEVRLRVKVDAQGRPESVRILVSSGHSRLDLAASSAVKEWRFVPARQGGMNVAAWVEVPIQFNLEK